MTPIEVYQTYLAFKNHFTKENYDFFKYCGKVKTSKEAFTKRKDRYFFERLSRKRTDEEITNFFIASFSQSKDPQSVWIGEIIDDGEKRYASWTKKMQSLSYLIKTESEDFFSQVKLDAAFDCTKGHPLVLKNFLIGKISLETMVIYDRIFLIGKEFDKKLFDPVWETVSFKIKKYKPFLNIDTKKYKQILRDVLT